MSTSLTNRSVVCAVEDQVSADLQGEAAILHLASGTYFGLNPVGARVWELVQSPRPVAEITDALVDEYDVDRARCETDLLRLLGELLGQGLLEVRDAAAR